MYSKLVIIMLFLAAPLALAADGNQTNTPQHDYIGAEYCGMCHHGANKGNQLEIWKKSKHAQAYKTLLTAQADKIAKEKGFKTPAAKTPECLKCHVTAYGVPAKFLGPRFKMEDGIQCEECHGPGGDYKNLSVMKNKQEAIAKGLEIHTDLNKFCTKCHNSESPFYKKFDAEKMWAEIKHPIPAEKK